MSGSAHIDTFARDRLPPPEQWPDLRLDAAGLAYPERLNATAELLDAWIARGHADRPCLIAPTGAWSYGRLHDTVNRIARHLVEAHGLVPGNRVLLRGPNTPMLAACWLAVVKAGGIAVPTMPLLRRAELSHMVEAAEVRLALCDAGFTAELDGLPKTLLRFNGAVGGSDGLEAAIAGLDPVFEAVDTAADDIALIAFTSGTTGRPKATAHFHRDLLAVADLSPKRLLRTGPDDVFCGTPTVAFAYGMGGLLLFPLRAGASAVLLDRPSPERLLAAIAAHRPTLCFTIPTVYRAMTALIEEGEAQPPDSLRACVSAGEPLPEATFTAWQAVTGLEILDSLGTTEMLNAFLHAEPGAVRPGATGRPVPGYEVMVVDDDLAPLPPGQVGRLAVRGPTGCRYLADERQALYVREGWNLTGDAVRVDEDGVFWYQGRMDDLIVSSGYKISGLEIEEVLMEHPAVDEVAVIATPDGLRGSIPKAFVVVRPPFRPGPELMREMQDFVKARIAPYKYPRALEFIEALPRTETGKLQRYKLRQRDGY
ncbi:AMP-binding protein [Azospirillum sp.]|uniref:AMP-binding protein n=1 Tax=Azospirillum sp. TaxID=34012 RepID=UPI003D718F81